MISARHRLPFRFFATLALAGTALSVPALAQSDPEARIKRLESEVRALQRKVFPGGDGKYFEAQIAAPATAATPVPAVATGPVNDLMGRIEAVEGALARITAQGEENANRMAKLEARLAAFEANAPTAQVAATVADSPPASARPASITGSIADNALAMSSASRPSAERIAAVAAIEKPASGDAGEDDYLYGYRLWEAKFFPEAAQQLKAMVDKHPRHKRISYARNLLGRAYLDDGKPGTAAQAFLQNYQADKAGERAPDSLLYLAVAMTRLKETQKACMALTEFAEAYPAEAAGRLAGQYAEAQKSVKCN